MALSDWSSEQRLRKQIALVQLSDRTGLSKIIREELEKLDGHLPADSGLLAQEHLQSMTANVFTSFFCGQSFHHSDRDFQNLTQDYYQVFEKASRPHLSDFLPGWLSSWLFPFYLRGMKKCADSVRSFVLRRLVAPSACTEDNFASRLWTCVRNGKLSSDSALYMLEDLLGGYAAVASMLLRTLINVACHPEVQDRIRGESKSPGDMPYTQAVVLETLRMASSPIIPHVANRDVTIKDWTAPKGTWFLFNQVQLNSDPKTWEDPLTFNPDRFLNKENRIQRPSHFFPFGGGSRACLGSRLVLLLLRHSLETLVGRFHIQPVRQESTVMGGHRVQDFSLKIHRLNGEANGVQETTSSSPADLESLSQPAIGRTEAVGA